MGPSTHQQGLGEAVAAGLSSLELAAQLVVLWKSHHEGKHRCRMRNCGEVKSTGVANFIQNTEILLKACFWNLASLFMKLQKFIKGEPRFIYMITQEI